MGWDVVYLIPILLSSTCVEQEEEGEEKRRHHPLPSSAPLHAGRRSVVPHGTSARPLLHLRLHPARALNPPWMHASQGKLAHTHAGKGEQ